MSRVMTYAEIAATFGIAHDSARRLVRRKRWTRTKGNDGTARIEVPLDALPTSSDPDPGPRDSLGDDPEDGARDSPDHGPGMVQVLVRIVDRLQNEVDRLYHKVPELRARAQDRDILAVQVEAMRFAMEMEKQKAQEVLAAERCRIEELCAALTEAHRERDTWRTQAERLALPAPAPARSWRWWTRVG
jgi:hypothetical protein